MSLEGELLMVTFRSIWTRLVRGPQHRNAFAEQQLKRLVPFQIRALRKKRGWSQEELARRAGVTQGVVSRAEDPDYGNLTFNTVINICRGFDVAFIGKFVGFSEFDDFFTGLSEESSGNVPDFDTENARIEELIAERFNKSGSEMLQVSPKINSQNVLDFESKKVLCGNGQSLLGALPSPTPQGGLNHAALSCHPFESLATIPREIGCDSQLWVVDGK